MYMPNPDFQSVLQHTHAPIKEDWSTEKPQMKLDVKKIFTNNGPLFSVLILACIVRIAAAFLIMDMHTNYYWEYRRNCKKHSCRTGIFTLFIRRQYIMP